MSSVQDTVKCPQCGGCYTTDFDCRTLEEFKFCDRCEKNAVLLFTPYTAKTKVNNQNRLS